MAEEAYTKTSLALILIGMLGAVVVWKLGYQGDLKGMLLDLLIAPFLGVLSAELYRAVHYRLKPFAFWPVWITIIAGAALAGARLTEPTSSNLEFTKMMFGGALYGAILATLCASALSWFICRLVPLAIRK